MLHNFINDSLVFELEKDINMIRPKIDSFVGLDRFGQIEGYMGCQIINSHLKLIITDGQLEQAKGYIGCFRTAAPALL